MYAALIVLAVLLTTIWIFRKSDPKVQRLKHEINKIPGPYSLPVVGTTYLLFGVKRRDLLEAISNYSKKFWPIFRTWIGPIAQVNLSDADHIQTILRSSVNIKKGFVYNMLQDWLGMGLLTSSGQKWHSRRKLITPTFHFKILDSFREVFAEKTQILVEKLEKEVGNIQGFDIYPYITLCTLDIICETAMGTAINAQENTNTPYVSAIYEISELIIERNFSPWLHPDFIYYLTKRGKRYKECLDILHTFSKNVIAERKRNARNVAAMNTFSDDVESAPISSEEGRSKKRMAFLDLLLEAYEDGMALTDEDIREEVDTFMFEGHDTTTSSLCWTIFLLGTHSEVQEAVYEEQVEIFQDSNRVPSSQDLAEMKYLERVIKECLRLYPAVPFITRFIEEDVQIEEFTLPAGCQVNIHIYKALRNPKYFPDPDTFNPDNFLPENVQNRHPFAYVPFSAGPRNCIGQRFALLEEKTILSAIVRRFRIRALEKASEIKPTVDLVLRPENGIRVALERR